MARYPTRAARRFDRNVRGPTLAGDGRAHQTHRRRYYPGESSTGGDTYRPQGRVRAHTTGNSHADVLNNNNNNNADTLGSQGINPPASTHLRRVTHESPEPLQSQQGSQRVFVTHRPDPIRMINEPVRSRPAREKVLADETNVRKPIHGNGKTQDPIERLITNPKLRAVLAGKKPRGPPRKANDGLQLRLGPRGHQFFPE